VGLWWGYRPPTSFVGLSPPYFVRGAIAPLLRSFMKKILKKFLQANAHIGKKSVNPAMFPYIRGVGGAIAPHLVRLSPPTSLVQNESSIFDLSQTLKCCRHLFQFFNVLSRKRHHILFFNTRPELNNLTLFVAKHLNQSAIVNQWTGGTLTNWKQMKKTALFFSACLHSTNSPIIRQFKDVCDSFPRLKKSRKLFGYARKQSRPNFVVILDPNNSEYAINEAYSLKLPITAFVDSDTPSALLKKITFPIPSNNRSLQFMYWVFNSMVLSARRSGSGGALVEGTQISFAPHFVGGAIAPHFVRSNKPLGSGEKLYRQPLKSNKHS
jgi:ribosomal protein S2